MIATTACALAAFGCAGQCRDDDPGRMAAFQAAWAGDTEAMRRLIAPSSELANARQCPPRETLMGKLVSRQIGAGTTSVLHVGARQGHNEFVALLLANGADVDARGRDTPLAETFGDSRIEALLRGRGADR